MSEKTVVGQLQHLIDGARGDKEDYAYVTVAELERWIKEIEEKKDAIELNRAEEQVWADDHWRS